MRVRRVYAGRLGCGVGGLILATALCGGTALADEISWKFPIIATQGKAEVVVAVDRMDVNAQFQHVEQQSALAMRALNHTADVVRRALDGAGLSIASSTTNIHPNTQRRTVAGVSHTEVVSYTASISFQIEGLDSEQAGRAIDVLSQHSPANLRLQGHRSSRQDEYALKLPAMAALNARDKALAIAKAYDCQGVLPLQIAEAGLQTPRPMMRSMAADGALMSAAMPEHQVDAGTVTLSAGVTAEFRMVGCP